MSPFLSGNACNCSNVNALTEIRKMRTLWRGIAGRARLGDTAPKPDHPEGMNFWNTRVFHYAMLNS